MSIIMECGGRHERGGPKGEMYDKTPYLQVTAQDGDCFQGWRAISEKIRSCLTTGSGLVCIECYPGVFIDELSRSLYAELGPHQQMFSADWYLSADQVDKLVEPYLSDDPVLGRMNSLAIRDFVDPRKLSTARSDLSSPAGDITVALGTGASLLTSQFHVIPTRYTNMRPNFTDSKLDNRATSTATGIVLSFDLGGTHVAAMAARLSDPFNGAMTSLTLDEGGSATYLFNRLEEVGRLALSALNLSSDLAGIAVAVPGPFDYSNGVSWLQHKFASWFGINVRRHLATRFGVDEKDVLFLNDADAFLFGELRDSFAPKAAGITLGTGVGAAFAIDGRAVAATEILPNNCDLHLLPWKGSTVEEFISTRGIMRLHEDRKGPYRSVKEIAANASVDSIAADTMSAFGKELGLVVETYLFPFAPNAIFLGGSISRSPEAFLPAALSVAPVLSDLLKISLHFERAALLGAIADWGRRSLLRIV